MPPERIIFLHRLLEPSICIVTPYIHTFLESAGSHGQLLLWQTLSESILQRAAVNLGAPPVCHSAESILVVLYLCRNLDWICEWDDFHIFSEPWRGTAQVFLNFDQLYFLRPWHFFPQISTQKQHWQQERGL